MIYLRGKNWLLFLQALIVVAIVVGAKLAVHSLGLELLSLNNLFSGIIAGNVFLMSFLLSGVLTDYKEAERIPGEMANTLAVLYEECEFLASSRSSRADQNCVDAIADLVEQTGSWFHRRLRTRELLDLTRRCNILLSDLEPTVPANHVVRLKSELTGLRRLIVRTDTIRDTSFISSGYLIASSVTGLLCIGLILSRIEPFTESLFFVGVISFLMIFLLLLIRDLDDPFAFEDNSSAENVSLYPIERLQQQIVEERAAIGANTRTTTLPQNLTSQEK
ncbi:MAG: hypothetical protein WAU88_05935 [Candidatus Zixiibacteriota bacterium]